MPEITANDASRKRCETRRSGAEASKNSIARDTNANSFFLLRLTTAFFYVIFGAELSLLAYSPAFAPSRVRNHQQERSYGEKKCSTDQIGNSGYRVEGYGSH